MLTCQNVCKDFGGVRALQGVTATLAEGEILGLVGPNGSGKSTLINCITGFYQVTSGAITLHGQAITRRSPHEITNLGIARTYQIPRPFGTMSVLQNVAVSAMFGRRNMSLAGARAAAREALDFTGLGRFGDRPVTDLNLHQRKFLELARALASRPQVLLLDEVNAGLNHTEIDEAVAMIRRIHESGVTIIIVEHLMRVVTSLATRLVVLNYGQVIAEGEPKIVMRDPEVITAYLGQDYVHDAA